MYTQHYWYQMKHAEINHRILFTEIVKTTIREGNDKVSACFPLWHYSTYTQCSKLFSLRKIHSSRKDFRTAFVWCWSVWRSVITKNIRLPFQMDDIDFLCGGNKKITRFRAKNENVVKIVCDLKKRIWIEKLKLFFCIFV